MKHLNVFLVVILTVTGVTNAQDVTFWVDDFETDKGWTFTGEFERGTPSGGRGDTGNSNPTSAYSGYNAIGTNLNGGYLDNLGLREYTAESPIIDCSGKNNISLKFQRWLAVERNWYDHAYIDVFNGTSWENVWENEASNINESSWNSQSIDISAFADNNANVQIRFALGSTDGSVNYYGWNIDDVELISSPDPVSGDYQTRKTANWSAKNTWQIHNGTSWGNTNNDPGENGNAVTVNILSGHTITLNENRPKAGYSIQHMVVDGRLNIGNNNTVRSLTIVNSITGAGTVDMTRNNGSHNLTVGGDFLPGTFSAGSANLYLNGSSTQKVGAFTYNNFTVSGGGDKELQGNVTINGNLNLNGAKIFLGDYDLIITDGASITGTFSSTNMIVTNGTGRLIKEGNANADYQMVYPVGTGSYYTPYEISSITCSDATGSVSVRALSGVAPGPPVADTKDLQKYWEISESGLTVTSADVSFTYDNAEVGSGGNQSSYALQVYSGGAWLAPAGASALGSNPMTASGANFAGIWTAIEQTSAITYYSYRSGNWNDVSTWTHDPGGTTQTAADIPGDDARVVILNGRTVTITDNVTNSGLSMAIMSGGFLNMSTYQFISTLTELTGQGTLKLASANFPNIVDNYLVAANGGTVEYNNTTNFNLPASQTIYNHLIINGSAIATQKHNLNVFGNLHVKNGTYRINDGSSARLQLSIEGNVTVNTGASITVGTGNTNTNDTNGGTAPFIDYYDNNTHRVVINGDFTNNGTVRFTNQSYPVYNSFPTNGAATVYFRGASDNILTCNNQTDFYNLVLDKGVDQTFKLSVYSKEHSNFRLFGRNDQGLESSGSNPNIRKALWIRTGTLELTGLTVIPSLTEGGKDYLIPANGCLLLNGPEVIVLSTANNYAEVNASYGLSAGTGSINGVSVGGNQAFSIYGKLQVDDGYLSSRRSAGFITWSESSGEFIINGGQVDARQVRSAGTDALSSYNQTGGVLTLRGRLLLQENPSTPADISAAGLSGSSSTSDIDGNYGTFSSFLPGNVFVMSGGEIDILDVSGSNGYAFDVASDSKNINVTGGTISFKPQGASNDAYKIRSSAPFYNFVINNEGTGSASVQLEAYSAGGITIHGERVVLNNLTLSSGTLNANNYDLSIGGDFNLAAGTTYTPGSNRTIFNGLGQQKLIMDLSSILSLNKLVIDKAVDELLLDGDQPTLNVTDSLIIKNGDLNCDTKNITAYGNIYIAGRQLGTSSGRISVLGSAQTISGNGNGEVYYLKLNVSRNVILSTDLKVTGTLEFEQNHLFDIGTNNLSFGTGARILDGGANRYIKTAGNAGDGGVTFAYDATTAKTWPIGVDAYTPAVLGFTSAPTSYGDVTIVPVNYEHPTTTSDNEALSYFWRIKSTGFTGTAGKVSHVFNYDQSDADGNGNEANYLPARYDVSSYAWNQGTTGDIDATSNQINDWTTPTQSADYIDGDYTAGEVSAFGTPQKYYSRQTGRWNQTSTWSTTSHTAGSSTAIPGASDIVIIGNGHTVSLERWNNTANRDVQSCASLQIEVGSDLDVTYNPASSFGMVVSHPNGNGLIRISVNDNSGSIFEFPGGDFSDFNANLGTTELYTNNATSGRTYWLPDGVVEYGNLMISPLGGSNIIFPNNDVTILGDLTADGQSSQSWYCPTWNSDYPNGFANRTRQAKTITIKGNYDILGGALIYYGNNGLAQDFIVEGDLIVAEDAGIEVYSNASNQSFAIGGSLINNSRAQGGGADAYRGCNFKDIPLTFFGDSDAKITQSSGVTYTTFTNIETITLSKGSSQSTTLTMDISGTVNYETNEWLTLVNGTFVYNRNANVTINTNNSFIIPGTAGLMVNTNNSFNLCQGNNDDYDVYLNGKLTVIDGTVNIGDSSNNRNNDIEYSGGGLSEIDVQGGSLYVNGQVRRNPASSAGVLKYNQSGGDVIINGRSALVTNAKLEILNTGSEFNMSDGSLTIMRGGSTTYGDLYLRPEKSQITGGEIIFENLGVGSQNYLLDSNVPLNDLTITGDGSNATVKLLLSPLTVEGDLTLSNSYSILDANVDFNVELTLNGDFVNNGSYNYYQNTTKFDGGTQEVRGSVSVSFYNLEVSPLTSLTLSKDVIVNNTLTLSEGVLAVGGNVINAKGDVINNASYTSTGDGLVLNGTVSQELSGTGTFARLELANSAGAFLGNDISLQGELSLVSGVLDIKSYLLSLGETASIVGTFGVGNMITTNGVYSNKGIEKIMTSGDSPAFTFPIGVAGKYTPAVLDLSASANVASVRIHPVNSKHPANIDPANVLTYYWAVESVGLNGVSGMLNLSYTDEDVQGDDANYYAERLLVPGTSWAESNSVDETNNIITFSLSGDDISGEYTAGLDAAFPDNIPQYTSNGNGNWSDPGIWTQTGGDTYPLTGAPNGFIVFIEHEVTLNENFVLANKITIENVGKLKIDNSTYGHILNKVSGSGTLYLEDGQLPEGNFNDFLGCSNNSTLEFGGTGDYAIVADLFNNAANLVFSGSGTRVLPNADLTVCSRLLINGPTLDNSIYNRKLYIKGSFERTAGSFISGIGSSATVSFNGSGAQTIGGFAGLGNELYNLEVNNSAGLTLSDEIEVAGVLMLTDGIINTTLVNTLTITNAAVSSVTPVSGKSSSFVNGPLTKLINQGDSFTFPIGINGDFGRKLTVSAVQTGTKLWTAEYKKPNNTSSNFAFPLTAINSHEYWRLSTDGGGLAKVQLGWDSSSDITPVMTEHGLADIRVVNYDGSNWQELSSTASGADAAGQVITNNRVSVGATGSDFTTATVNTNKPKVRLSTAASICDLVTGIKVEMTSTVPTTAGYELSYTIDGGAIQTVTVTSFPFYLPTPSVGIYELKGFKYDDKAREGVFDPTSVEVFASPTTSAAGADQSLQGASQATLAANTPIIGAGQWAIVSGTGGSFVDPTDPISVFSGTNGSSYVLSWTITNGDCQSVDQVSISFPILVPHTWLGTESSNWFAVNNWSDKMIPDNTHDVTIDAVVTPAADPIISGVLAAQVRDLTIESGASLTVAPGAKMTVLGNVTCDTDDQLIVINETAAPASVIIEGVVNTKVQVKWTYASRRYWYIGQATDGAMVKNYGIPSADVFIYDFPGYWNSIVGAETKLVGANQLQGYSVMFKDPKEVVVSGKLNTGEQSRLLPEDSDRLVANPYLSYLNLDNMAGFDFGDAQQTVWTRTTFGAERALATYNITEGQGANGGTKYIAPGQSFWVQTNAQSTTFKVNYAARVHGEGALKSSGNANSEGVLRFVMSDGEIADEGVLIFREYGESFFSARDSEKRMVSEAIFPQVYSLKGDKKVTISVVSNLESAQSIPLGMIIPSDGEFSFNVTNIAGFMPEYGVTLEDLNTGNVYDIRNNPTVSLSLSKGTHDDRFLLHFTQTSTEGGEGIGASETTKPTIYAANGDAYIKISSEQLNNNIDDCFVEVYDFSGKKYINLELLATQTKFELPEESKLWIVVVRIGNNSYQEKVSSFK